MAAFLISDVSVRDVEAFQTYRTRAAASIAQYGGRYLARGGTIEPLEGTWEPRVIIVVEFPSIEQARGNRSHPPAVRLPASWGCWAAMSPSERRRP